MGNKTQHDGNLSCEALRSLLPELRDLPAGNPRLQAAESHLGRCASCREERERLGRLLADFQALPTPPAADLVPTVRAHILMEAARRSDRPARRAPWLGLAAAALISAGIVIALQAPGPAVPSASVEALSPTGVQAQVVELRMEKGQDGVRVRWTDGRGETYQVLRSVRPDAWREAEKTLVTAREWTEPAPEAGNRLTYYRVETVRDSWH